MKHCVHCATLTNRIHNACGEAVCLNCAQSHIDDHKRVSYTLAYRRYLLATGQISFTVEE